MRLLNQRPESLSQDLKRIAIEFTHYGQEEERRAIKKYIDHIVAGHETNQVHIDDWKVLSTVSESTRKSDRVKFNNCFVPVITIKAETNKVIKLKAELIDLSDGGACIAIPDHIKVHRRKKNPDYPNEDPPNIKIKFDFLGGIILKGVIRHLKNPKLDPAIDLDNYDFEYTLPAYWKINA